jgi:hypothetical protein
MTWPLHLRFICCLFPRKYTHTIYSESGGKKSLQTQMPSINEFYGLIALYWKVSLFFCVYLTHFNASIDVKSKWHEWDRGEKRYMEGNHFSLHCAFVLLSIYLSAVMFCPFAINQSIFSDWVESDFTRHTNACVCLFNDETFLHN